MNIYNHSTLSFALAKLHNIYTYMCVRVEGRGLGLVLTFCPLLWAIILDKLPDFLPFHLKTKGRRSQI